MTVKRKLKLKKQYKNMLTDLLVFTCILAVMFGAFKLYQDRYNKINGQRPAAIEIFQK